MTEILIGSNTDDVTTLPQTAEEKAKQLPEPMGYRMLVAIPDAEKEHSGGILKADQTLHMEEVLSTVFFVLKWDLIVIKTKSVSQMVRGVKSVTLF